MSPRCTNVGRVKDHKRYPFVLHPGCFRCRRLAQCEACRQAGEFCLHDPSEADRG